MFSLSIFPHRSYKVKGRFERKLSPLFLADAELKAIPLVLKLYKEASEKGWSRRELEEKTLQFESKFPGRKFAAVIRTLADFFEFRERSLEEVLPTETYSAITRKGIHSVFTLSMYLYDVLSHEYKGYIPLGERESFLEKMAEALSLPSKETLEEIINLNLEENQLVRLKEKQMPSIIDIEQSYSRHSLETILNNSIKLTILKKSKTGAFVKDSIRFCKKFLLDFDVYLIEEKEENRGKTSKDSQTKESAESRKGEAVVIEVEGPREVSGSPSDYSWHLSQFMNILIRRYPNLAIEAIVKIRNKICFYNFTKKDLLILKGTKLEEQPRSRAIDSQVEARFQRYFSMNTLGWKLYAEPRALIFEDEDGKKHVMIPDFEIKRGINEEYLLEIIGYYRESYIVKKIKKLEMLKDSTSEKIILLIDDKIVDRFKRLKEHYPIFTYGVRRPFPISRILDFLEENVSSFEARIEELKKNKVSIISENLDSCSRDKGFLLIKDLCNLFDLYSEEELETAILDPEIVALYQGRNLKWISGLGLISKELLEIITQKLSSIVDERGLPLTVLQKRLELPRALSEKITQILEHLPEIEVIWSSLMPIVKLKK